MGIRKNSGKRNKKGRYKNAQDCSRIYFAFQGLAKKRKMPEGKVTQVAEEPRNK